MPVVDILLSAFAALRANAMRSLSTMLGVVIGVSSVITMIALGNGAQNAVKERIGKLGTTVLQINPQRVNQGGVNTTAVANITMKDIEMLRDSARFLSGINARQDRDLQVVCGNKNTSAQITGTGANFLRVRRFRMAAGRMFSEGEHDDRRRLAVIGAEVLLRLDIVDAESAIDQPIRIRGRQFTVVGVLASRGLSGVGDGDNQILIPFNTGRFEVFGSDRIQDVWARASTEQVLDSAMIEIQRLLRRAHNLRYEQADDFGIRNQSDFRCVARPPGVGNGSDHDAPVQLRRRLDAVVRTTPCKTDTVRCPFDFGLRSVRYFA